MRKRKSSTILWLRLSAFIVDSVILCLVMFLLSIGLHLVRESFPIVLFSFGREESSLTVNAVYSIIAFSLAWSYSIFMLGRYQATFGKRLLNLKVVGENNRRISYGLAAYREIVGLTLSAVFCFVGFLWAFFNVHNQAWHDKLARTYVVYSSRHTYPNRRKRVRG
jgi:uncharacterized RDD family membrane protein YckC